MALEAKTIASVNAALDGLSAHCADLLTLLEREAVALAQMRAEEVQGILAAKAVALEHITEADEALRSVLHTISEETGTAFEQILIEGPLAEACAPSRQRAKQVKEALHQANEVVRTRAQLGLNFFQSYLGGGESYGATGAAETIGAAASGRFHRVV